MRKRLQIRLTLSRETVRQLDDTTLVKANGAAPTTFACSAYSICTPCIPPPRD